MRKGFTFIESDFCLDPEELPPAGHLKECRSDALASLSYLFISIFLFLFIYFVCLYWLGLCRFLSFFEFNYIFFFFFL